MKAATLVEQKLLNKQFLINELGRKTAIVLPIKEFEAFLEEVDDLANLATDSGQKVDVRKDSSEEKIELTKYYYDILDKTWTGLVEYTNL